MYQNWSMAVLADPKVPRKIRTFGPPRYNYDMQSTNIDIISGPAEFANKLCFRHLLVSVRTAELRSCEAANSFIDRMLA